MFSFRQLGILLLCCVAGVLLIWYSQQVPPQAVSHPTSDARTQASGNPSKNSLSDGSLLSAFPSRQLDTGVSRNKFRQSGMDDNRLGIYNESVRSLMRSNNIAKVDYGLFQLRNVCRSFLNGQDGITVVKRLVALPQTDKADALVIGDATEAERLAGFQRSLDKCTKLYEGARLTQSDQDAISALPSVLRYRAVLNSLGNAKTFDGAETLAALSDAASGPMFGALSPLLAFKVDYTELVNAYGKEQSDALRSLTVSLVLCRLGDDCGPGDTVTEQLCWENGICGDYVDSAIFSNLRDRGMDTTAFSQFITRVHQALLVRDTSIFRKQKTTK